MMRHFRIRLACPSFLLNSPAVLVAHLAFFCSGYRTWFGGWLFHLEVLFVLHVIFFLGGRYKNIVFIHFQFLLLDHLGLLDGFLAEGLDADQLFLRFLGMEIKQYRSSLAGYIEIGLHACHLLGSAGVGVFELLGRGYELGLQSCQLLAQIEDLIFVACLEFRDFECDAGDRGGVI